MEGYDDRNLHELVNALKGIERFLERSLANDEDDEEDEDDSSVEIRRILRYWAKIEGRCAKEPFCLRFLLESYTKLCFTVQNFVNSVHRNYEIQKTVPLFRMMKRLSKLNPELKDKFENLMNHLHLRLDQNGLKRVDKKFYKGRDYGDEEIKELMEYEYLHNLVFDFVQSTFSVLTTEKVRGKALVVSGDGRYFTKEAIQIIIKMAAHNGVRRVWIAQNGLLSTPAASAVVRERVGLDRSKAFGAFILTACHNRGGHNEDFGIKYIENGGPVPKEITKKIYHQWLIKLYEDLMAGIPDVDLSMRGSQNISGLPLLLHVEVFDPIEIYLNMMKSIFDFPAIQKLFSCPKFTFCYDALHGVAGVYARRIFVEELGADGASLLNCVPKEDFGGRHPDPNLTYATELLECMGLGKSSCQTEPPEFGAAADGDGDRYMVLGKRFFVTPSDSLAIIVANAAGCIPYFHGGLKGVARSMPTSAALDVVAHRLGLNVYEVPTSWKYFCNLMDAGLCSICGDENFGIGSDHLREKDGIWAVLAWLSILAHKNKDNLSGGKLISVEDIVRDHWKIYGRHYHTRHVYQDVDLFAAKKIMDHLVELQSDLSQVNRIVKEAHRDVFKVVGGDEFEYKDVDGSISKQGIRYFFEDGSRVVFSASEISSEGARLLARNSLVGETSTDGATMVFRYSKTVARGGTSPYRATIRIYIDKYEEDPSKTDRDSQETLAPLVDVALKLSKIQDLTGRSAPTLVT